jgi:hypothetical protein
MMVMMMVMVMMMMWSRVECEAAVGSNVRSVPTGSGNSHTMSYALICCLLLGLEEWTSHIRRGKKSEQGIKKILRISPLYQHVVRLS